MALSRSEQLTAQFYEWEQKGRGWHTFDTPVELEPVFEPFFGHRVATPDIDDGKRHTLLSYISKSIRDIGKEKEAPEEPTEYFPSQAYQFISDEPISCFSISLPEGEKLKAEEVEKFLVMLSYCQAQVSFEIVATANLIRLQFVCREPDTLHVQSQVKAYFPKCIIQHQTVSFEQVFDGSLNIALIDYGLKDEYMRPLAMLERLEPDPLTGLFGVLGHLQDDQRAVIQILFKGAVNSWAESIIRSVTDADGSSFFMDAPEMPKLAMEKISSPLFGVIIRVIGQGSTDGRTLQVVEKVGAALIQSSRGNGNVLISLSSHGYAFEDFLNDAVLRQSHRAGMILNARELATFVHYPVNIASKRLERDIKKTKALPPIAQGHDFILGKNIHQGVETIATVSSTQRLKHTHIIGATGTGKSTLLQDMIVQDIMLGNGVAVLDPHGDLIESILPYIPESRWNDVIVVDPADSSYPVGFNILTAHSDIEKEILASDLVSVFRRLSTSFGDQMHSVLANAILAFVESNQGGTLIDLRRFLIEKPYREAYLQTVNDPNIVYYWQKEFPLLKSSSIGPILTRLDSFLRPKLLRNMVAQKKSLDFEDILDTQKIIFIKLSQGLIGTENSYLLGTFFVSKIYQAAMARQAIAKGERKDFFLYIDEFQNFITPSMSSILSGTRKYGLACILAHQDMIQLQKYDSEIASSVISNAGTRICFRVGDIDAKRFAEGFSSFEALDLQNLGVGEAIVRIERPEFDFTLSTLQLNEPDAEKGELAKKTVISLSREKYGTPRAEVEKSLEYLKGETVSQVRETIQKEEIPEADKPQPLIPATKQEPVKPVEIQDAATTETFIKQKEQSEHRYLQTLIKQIAEARGYKATIEEPTPNGKGRVDVSLERNGKKIACEVGVTTAKEWEVHNIEKCLTAGYEVVIAVSTEKKTIETMQKEIQLQISELARSKVLVMEPEELFLYLDKETAKEASTEKRVKGYRVKVEYDAVSEEAMKQKRDSIAKMVTSQPSIGKERQ